VFVFEKKNVMCVEEKKWSEKSVVDDVKGGRHGAFASCLTYLNQQKQIAK
jgi:hypothetical protein